MNPAEEHALNFRCVALLYFLFNNKQDVEVSDTTGDATKNKSR